jgi:hypothetical protein
VELHDGQNPEGSEVPGRGEFHDDGRCGAVPGFQQGQRDAGIRYFSPVKGLSHEIKMDDANKLCLADLPSAGTARCCDQVFFSCKRTVS